MSRWVTWIVVVVVLAAAVYVAVAVPLGGRTLLERITGEDTAGSTADQPATSTGTVSDRASSGRDDEPKNNDRLTKQDRRKLDRLIQKKLQEEAGGEARPPGQP